MNEHGIKGKKCQANKISHGKRVILLKDKITEIPTDLQGIEYFEYLTIDSLKKNLKEYLRTIVA